MTSSSAQLLLWIQCLSHFSCPIELKPGRHWKNIVDPGQYDLARTPWPAIANHVCWCVYSINAAFSTGIPPLAL